MTPRVPSWFEAEVRRRAARGFDHMVIISDHARDRMVEREVTRTMVMRVLRRGSVDGSKMKFNSDFSTWEAPIVGITAGVEVRVVCAISEHDPKVVVVTVVNHGSA